MKKPITMRKDQFKAGLKVENPNMPNDERNSMFDALDNNPKDRKLTKDEFMQLMPPEELYAKIEWYWNSYCKNKD